MRDKNKSGKTLLKRAGERNKNKSGKILLKTWEGEGEGERRGTWGLGKKFTGKPNMAKMLDSCTKYMYIKTKKHDSCTKYIYINQNA